MPEIIHVTPDTLNRDVYTASNTVLLDLWAPWCAPCLALSPNLEKLARLFGDNLQVTKLNVEQYPEAMAQFGVRGIPAMMLFKDGVEVSRELGNKPLGQLTEWVKQAHVQLAPQAPLVADAPLYGAFYNDNGLKTYLCERLLAHADRGEIQVSRAPFRNETKSTAAAALVHSTEVDVFERITGLQGAFASVLDFVQATDTVTLEPLLAALKVGTDLSQAPARVMHAFFNEPSFDWPGLLAQAPELDSLRNEWLAQCQLALDRQPVMQAVSSASAVRIKTWQDHDDPAVSQVAKLLDALTPLPVATESDTWSDIFANAGRLFFALGQHYSGWTFEERHMEVYRFQWFSEKQKQSATGKFTEVELAICREQWVNENGAYQHKEGEFMRNQVQGIEPIRLCVRAHLSEILNRAPQFIPA